MYSGYEGRFSPLPHLCNYVEFVSKMFKTNAPSRCTHNAMPRNDTDNHFTHFTSRSTRVRGRPPVVDGFDNRIISYEFVCPHRDAQVREFIGEFDGRTPSGKFIRTGVTRKTTYDVDIISFHYLIEISAIAVQRLGVRHIRTLIAAWLSECVVMFCLEILH